MFFMKVQPDFSSLYNSFQEAIFRVIAAILHLGNINFAKGKEIDSSVIKDEKSRFHLNLTAKPLRYVSFTCSH